MGSLLHCHVKQSFPARPGPRVAELHPAHNFGNYSFLPDNQTETSSSQGEHQGGNLGPKGEALCNWRATKTHPCEYAWPKIFLKENIYIPGVPAQGGRGAQQHLNISLPAPAPLHQRELGEEICTGAVPNCTRCLRKAGLALHIITLQKEAGRGECQRSLPV